MFQQTIKRLAFDGMQAPLLVCNKEHRFIVQEQLEAQNLASQAILLEPFGRNTAPAVAIAAMKLVAEGRDELLAREGVHLLRGKPGQARLPPPAPGRGRPCRRCGSAPRGGPGC
ncbi:sugar phosphate nucleotidyltransferase [Vibrio parahaemolyticus]|uniref:sugar phosphate nucleotidyltransferase n=1 Tax=Vibrio parahaemolyticus TaxID=670 RepID=UPI00201DCB50|nr:sugar phosphate nucleotidyltransferase [Vibrio parahaemolyticus]